MQKSKNATKCLSIEMPSSKFVKKIPKVNYFLKYHRSAKVKEDRDIFPDPISLITTGITRDSTFYVFLNSNLNQTNSQNNEKLTAPPYDILRQVSSVELYYRGSDLTPT